MPAAKKAQPDVEPDVEVVLVPFAYANAKNGEVVQLVKGDTITGGRFKEDSIDHLRSIGFIGKSN